jgi:hypothetical protein
MSDTKHDGRQILGDRVRTLEDEFFRQEDDRLVQRLRELKQKEASREALGKASGITNQAILDKLMELGIRPEIVGALAVIPLAEVAWADGTLDGREKQAILDRAEKSGIAPGSTGYELLTSWLEHKPEPKLLTSWIHMVQGICEQMTGEQVAALRAGLVERARSVAKASGGLFGVGSVSTAEEEMIKQLESAFRSAKG